MAMSDKYLDNALYIASKYWWVESHSPTKIKSERRIYIHETYY